MELVRFPSRGGYSVRSIFSFVLAVVIAAILWATFSSTPTHAAGEATWQSGTTILYDGHGYNQDKEFKDPTGTIPQGATIYKTPVQTVGDRSTDQKVFVLYFSPGVDPPTATSVKYVEFDYNNGTLANAQNQKDVVATPQNAEGNSGSSCSVGGIGWIICPVSEFLADAMDSMFEILANMIVAQPLVLGDTNNSMYVAWNIMRTIANIAFVIAFLIIIYSQLTNVAVSNYGLKKLIPRLIVAAVLVNISFFIAALAIDISNILGYSVQDVFNAIREQTFHLTEDNISGFNTNTWGAVTAAVLAGGGLVGGVYYMAAGGLYLLLPVLLGLLLTIIFVLVILAARQAIIVILVIIAPLAFVANLLPNTEKWFDKWKDLFFTMLIFFPAFSLVFGGSQLAGQLIIQNAGDNIIMLIFGMAVQIAPLVITPLLLKLSGGLLGRIAQIANNPRKGIIDRNRNWAQNRADHAKYQNIKRGARWYNPSSYGAGMVRSADFRKRRLSDNTDIWKQEATNRYEQTKKYDGINERKAAAELDKEGIHSHHAAHVEHLKTTPGTRIHNSAMTAQVNKDALETRQQQTGAYYNQQRITNGSALNTSYSALETSKSLFEASEQNKTAYIAEQRTYRVTQLGAAAERLEAAKLNAEGWQSNYTAHIDSLKLTNAPGLGEAARFAQSSKEHAEAAQNRVQTVFDRERTTAGTVLNTSAVELERTKITADGAKAEFTEYISSTKTVGGALHTEFIATERLKQAQQVSEAKLTRIIEEYKAGGAKNAAGNTIIDGVAISPAEQIILDQMQEDTARASAEQQGATSARYVQQSYVSSLMDEASVDPLSAEVLQTAAGIDPNGKTRAQANAISQLDKLEKEALTNSVQLLGDRAEKQGTTLKAFAKDIFAKHTGTAKDSQNNLLPREPQDPSIVEAALEALAQDGDISTLRKARMDTRIDQSMLTRLFARNSGNMKAKGGFDLQANPGLAGASPERMNVSIANTIGDVSANNISSLKAGWWSDVAKEFPRILSDVDSYDYATDPSYDMAGTDSALKKAYQSISEALNNPDIRGTIGDRLKETIEIHELLDARFGHNPNMHVDYDKIRVR